MEKELFYKEFDDAKKQQIECYKTSDFLRPIFSLLICIIHDVLIFHYLAWCIIDIE